MDFSNFIVELSWRDDQKKLFSQKNRTSDINLKPTLVLVLESLNLRILYLHFIWSWPFSLLIFFVYMYLLLHDCINLHCEEENYFEINREKKLHLIFSILLIFPTSQTIFNPFDDLNQYFNLLTQHSLISMRVIALWSQDHKLKTYTRT